MSLFKRRFRYTRDWYDQRENSETAELCSIVDQQRLELRSFKYKINQEIKFKNEDKGGYIMERSVKMSSGAAVTKYVVRVFQASWRSLGRTLSDGLSDDDDEEQDHHDFDIRRDVLQDDIESIMVANAKNKAAAEAEEARPFTKFPGVRSIDPEAKHLMMVLLERRACYSKAASSPEFASVSCLDFTKEDGRSGKEPIEAQIGDMFLSNEIKKKKVSFVDYLSESLHAKACNKMLRTQAGVDVLQNIQRDIQREEERVERERGEVGSTDGGDANEESKQRKTEMKTLELAPEAPGGWRWPHSGGSRHLRVDIDTFIGGVGGVGGVDETETAGRAEAKGEKKGKKKKKKNHLLERTFTTDVSVDEPILSIVHFLRRRALVLSIEASSPGDGNKGYQDYLRPENS